jgi:HEAT repeat protein
MGQFRLTGLLLVSLAAHALGQVKEPEYGGKTISEWLLTSQQENGASKEMKSAILHMGTNCLPYLIKAIQFEPLYIDTEPSRQRVETWQTNLLRKWNAMEVFGALGHQAAPAIPELLRLSRNATDKNNRFAAITALECLREDGLKPLMEIASDPAHPSRGDAIDSFGTMHHELGTNGRVAIPILMKCLHDQNPKIVSSAVMTLGRLGLEAEIVVPALTNLMRNANAQIRGSVISAFQFWPSAGALCAPTLITALSDTDLEVRQAATNALMSNPGAIHVAGTMGEPARGAVPIFVEALRGWDVGAEAAEALGNLGFDPPVAITALKRRVRDFQTAEGVACANALAKFGSKANWAAPELTEALTDSRIEIRVAATNALLKVMPEALQPKQLGNVPAKNSNPGIFRY